jgi:integration host factor subunit beta
MGTVTKRDLVSGVAEKCKLHHTVAQDALESVLGQIIEELARGNRIELRDFGVFETRVREAHKARNPRTKESVDVPARASVKFKTGRVMKDSVQRLTEPTPPAAPAEPEPAPAAPDTQE